MDLLHTSVQMFVGWLAHHQDIAYAVLFAGSYFETLIFTCIAVPGEPFFLAGGILAARHMLNLPLVLVFLYGGAILGDTTSFWVGRRISPALFAREYRFISRERIEKVHQLLKKHGPKGVFIARFLGPISWVTPFLAGSAGISYRAFFAYNVPGIVIAIGAFVAAGYFFGSRYALFLWFTERYILILVVLFALYYLVRWYVMKGRTSSEDSTLP